MIGQWAIARFFTAAMLAASFVGRASAQPKPPAVGPETEKRFPPLQVPGGFQATLFACDPLIEYPSAMAQGPRTGSIFLAIDYMTGLGTEIVRRDEIRLVEDTDGDGYADKARLYANGFNSIQGMTYHEGVVYVMHSPLLTALEDTDGDGSADERRDLLTGLGLAPEANPPRLHCANGLVMGHDGWLYLALGDHGCDVPRPEGDRLVFHGGGILRCRDDGTDLHVFATGMRNIYDVALDGDLNVYVRDNENDGGDYMIRVCRSFFGADHGYPYKYYERPAEALPPIADLGRGSSAGGLCYLETQFPQEYRGDLIFCEWGRSVVRYRPGRTGGGFAKVGEITFAAGAENDPYGFKPTDVVVDYDGSLLIADWADGQRPRRGRARVYRIAYVSKQDQAKPPPREQAADADDTVGRIIQRLDAPSYYVRAHAQWLLQHKGRDGLVALQRALRENRLRTLGRMHTIWIRAHVEGRAAIAPLLDIASADPDARVRLQAVRAVADLADPVLAHHRLDAEPGDDEVAARLAAMARDQAPAVLREIVVTLGRLRWQDSPAWLNATIERPDPALRHAAMQTLRRSGNWSSVLELLDAPDSAPPRQIALLAAAEQFDPILVDGLVERIRSESSANRRAQYADLLTRVHRKPPAWTYWGYRPAPRPANTVAWEKSIPIEQALDVALRDPDRRLRHATLKRMLREKVPTNAATLRAWLLEERAEESVSQILTALRDHPAGSIRADLEALLQQRGHSAQNRLGALEQYTQGLDASSSSRLLRVAEALEEGPVLAAIFRELARWPKLPGAKLLRKHLRATDAQVRAAAAKSIGTFKDAVAVGSLTELLGDPQAPVRAAAVESLAAIRGAAAADQILKAAGDVEPEVRRVCLVALRKFRERRGVPVAVAALNNDATAQQALDLLGELGGPESAADVAAFARRRPSIETLPRIVRMLDKWSGADSPTVDPMIADLQGAVGVAVRWKATGPVDAKAGAALRKQLTADAGTAKRPTSGQRSGAKTLFAAGLDSRVDLRGAGAGNVWFAWTDVSSAAEMPVEFLASANGNLSVWLNGKSLYARQKPRTYRADSDRFAATLRPGVNRLVVETSAASGPARFHVRFRQKAANARHEQLTRLALSRSGYADRGKTLFLDAKKSQCVKCHRIGKEGERFGPDLTGVGRRFSRIHIVESILRPSHTITPSYETHTVALVDGRVLAGVRIAETERTLTLVDNKGDKHEIAQSSIEARRTAPISTMPEGLEKPLTADEFVDLITFLVRQK